MAASIRLFGDGSLEWPFAALAVLVKGPFGLMPACGAALALAWVHRKPSALLGGLALAIAAAAPVALFLLARSD
jgi:4-amino-4-deoxy-L-arabinose transferase-like glycosyltransferase